MRDMIFLIVLLFTVPVIAQPPTWLDDTSVFESPAEVVSEPIEVVADPLPASPPENDTVAELRDLAKKLREDAQRFRDEAADQREKASKMSVDWLDNAERIANLESDVDALKSEKCVCNCPSEERIREICREEIQAVMSIRTPAGKVEPRSVTVTAGGGQFQLAPGERLVAIDGVPVSQISATAAATSGYQVQAVRSTLPRRSFAPITMQLQRTRGVFQRSSCYTDASGNRVCPSR